MLLAERKICGAVEVSGKIYFSKTVAEINLELQFSLLTVQLVYIAIHTIKHLDNNTLCYLD